MHERGWWVGVMACVLVLAACGSVRSTPSSASDAGEVDAATGTGAASASCPSGRVLYLNYEGASLTRATVSDATKNEASWMQKSASTVPVYMSGESNRVELIQEVTDGIRARLHREDIISSSLWSLHHRDRDRVQRGCERSFGLKHLRVVLYESV